MYGLKQAALSPYNFFKHNLVPYGYASISHTSGLWKHATRRIVFCLCIDDFSDNKDDALQWSGTHYCRLTIKRN